MKRFDINWEDIGRISGLFFLTVLEYSFKICATVAAAITIATPGAFSDKLSAGFSGLTHGLRKLIDAPGNLMEMGTVIHDYNIQTAAVFTETYGGNAVNSLLLSLNSAVDYLVGIYENFSQGAFATIAATFLVFLTFYLLAWVLRFARQKGRGSLLVRLERKLGKKIFKTNVSSDVAASFSSSPSTSVASSASKSIPGTSNQPKLKVPKTETKTKTTVRPNLSRSKSKAPKPEINKTRTRSKETEKKKRNTNGSTNGGYDHDPQTLTYILEAARSS